MKVKINGTIEEFTQDGLNLLEYLQRKSIQPELVAVEVNLNVVDKRRYGDVILSEGDEIEIVRFVGGGAR